MYLVTRLAFDKYSGTGATAHSDCQAFVKDVIGSGSTWFDMVRQPAHQPAHQPNLSASHSVFVANPHF
jgi:hypothetical protein